ncbi:hypothetical protein L798_04655 [Zootermopsis nevadensis]|uniref:Uncharacterized protein n=1 Tax=Zootermopsis nevadensis TaxID=136037 RepID=A0A067RAJ5_ZOONE|nr:hypothetical protein L798_04655 [Zootermopsis nevadensis]
MLNSSFEHSGNWEQTSVMPLDKIKLSHYMLCRRLGGSGGIAYSVLTSAPDGGKWSASYPGRALPPGKEPGTHWIGGWVGPRAGLDAEAGGKILCPRRGSNPSRPVRS